jgi:hypothetical protein
MLRCIASVYSVDGELLAEYPSLPKNAGTHWTTGYAGEDRTLHVVYSEEIFEIQRS